MFSDLPGVTAWGVPAGCALDSGVVAPGRRLARRKQRNVRGVGFVMEDLHGVCNGPGCPGQLASQRGLQGPAQPSLNIPCRADAFEADRWSVLI